MLQTVNPTEMVLDRLADREFAREWLKAHDEDLDAKDKRIEILETALLQMREIALECCSASDVPRINEIAKGAFKGREAS